MTPDPLTWVIGSGGLLGSSVVRLVELDARWRPPAPITWAQPDTAEQVAQAARAFLLHATDRPWQVVWCAGALKSKVTRFAGYVSLCIYFFIFIQKQYMKL